MEIVNAESAHGSICGFIVEMRSRKLRDLAPRSDFRRSAVFPVRAAIACNPEETVVGARPNRVHIFEGRRERVDHAANFVGVGILRGFVAEARGNRAMLAREIGTDGLPGLSAVRGLIKKIGGGIEHVRIDR